MKRFDLHTHSRYSDGTSTPAEVAARAAAARVDVAFLTDHDSVSGYPEARQAALGLGVDLRCGIEINTAQNNIHVLGYGIRWQDAGFQERLAEFRGRRVERIRRIVEKLRQAGVDITFEDIQAGSRETLGRPHVADALRRKGLVHNRQEAFHRFLVKDKPGYVASMGPSVEEAISLIREAGGFCSMAHPETLADKGELARWVGMGLEGLEVYYSSHAPSDILAYSQLARQYGLLATGGTDFHGPGSGRDQALGVEVPEEVYGAFMERLAKCG